MQRLGTLMISARDSKTSLLSGQVFGEAEKFEGPPSLWAARHQRILKLFDPSSIPSLLETAESLTGEVERLAQNRLWARHR